MAGGGIMSHKFDQIYFDSRKDAKVFLLAQHELATTVTELQSRMTKIEIALGITSGDE